MNGDQASPHLSNVLAEQGQAHEERVREQGPAEGWAPGSGGRGQLPLRLVGCHG